MKRIKYSIFIVFLSAFAMMTAFTAAKAISSSPAEAESAEAAKLQDMKKQGDSDFYRDMSKRAELARKTVVARVNGAEINMYDLVGMMNRVVQAYYPNVTELTDELTQEVKKRALDRLIFEELAVKEAVRQGINPKAADVQEVIDNIKKAYETEEGFQKYLQNRGLTEEQLRERIIRSRRLEGITGREVYQKVTVDPEPVEKLYDEYKKAGKLRKAEEYIVKEILVMAGEDEEATRATADRLLAMLKDNNNDFGKLVLDGTFIVRRIKVDPQRYPIIHEKMETMKVGDFSGVVEDGGTFHIFEVLEKEPVRDLTEEEARGFIEDRLMPNFQEKRRQAWIEELKKGADIEILLDDAENKLRTSSNVSGGTAQPATY